MDGELKHALKYKVNRVLPAIFADNMTKVVMEGYKVPWKMNYATKDCFKKFRAYYGSDMLFDIEVVVSPVYERNEQNPIFWYTDEYNFSKLLYNYKKKFSEYIAEEDEDVFMFNCSWLLYFSAMYFKLGLIDAPTIAFLEVYDLTCYYLQQKQTLSPELNSILCF